MTLGTKSQRVLIADDDPAILRLVTAIVEKEGFETVAAHDGQEALNILQLDNDFIAAIFDVMMPHFQGPEIVRRMRADKNLMHIPVMIMTAEQSLSLQSESFAAGAVVFVPKPFTTSQMQTMLRMLIRKKA
jgi:CheY-like chemotaxis protein